MANDPLERLHQREREQERHRLRELEAKDLEVESARGPRPLEGYAGGHTTWTGKQADDAAAEEEHGSDMRKSQAERQERLRMDAPEPDAEGP